MASSSRVSRTKYDVFISFRGTDVRPGILSHLKKELQQKHIDFYVDDRLERGDEISETLVRAIEESAMSLIMFSKDYAFSKWCLEELVKVIECMKRYQQIVIPVFYNIDPSDLRHQKGSYGEAFAEHDKNCKEKVEIWRSALNKAANLSGFHSANYKNEAEFVEQIAKSLSTRLNAMYQCDLRNLVGIEEKVAELETLMQQGSQDVRLIGIWGMGGIGKTTIATVLYNRFCYEYEGYYFQANVREESQKQGIVKLKKQIYERLLKEKDLDICTPNGVPSHIERKLRRTKILFVLDDINDSYQLEHLAGVSDCFGPSSRIIITTRDKEVLNRKVDKIYEVQPLMFGDALELFNLNAFKENSLDAEWIELSKRVIEYAKELPLALEVLGSFLHGKSKEEWRSQLKKLEKMPFKKIHNVLRLSYDNLDCQQKTIFLHIACGLKGFKKCQIINLLDACGFSTTVELAVLQDKALITWSSEKSYVSMHDLIEEMGKEIVREESMGDPEKCSHLWDFEDVSTVLQSNMGTASIESIILDDIQGRQLSFNSQVFARMHNMKFLEFSDYIYERARVNLHEGLEYLPDELRLLDWHDYPLKSLPSTFSAKNLVQLIMPYSKLEKLWDGVMPLGNLKEVDLSWSKHLVELPDFSLAKNLKQVKLSRCENLCSFHPSILSLPKIEKLTLSYCEKLASLTSNVHSKSLRKLILDHCEGLEEFSVTSGNMIKLDLSSTAIKELPSSIGSQTELEYLILDECKNLTHLPSSFVDLQSLILLDIRECKKLEHLPMLPPSIKKVWAALCTLLKTVQLDPLHRNTTDLRFENCMELDEDSCKVVELTGRRSLTNFASKPSEEQGQSLKMDDAMQPRVIYPGSKIPRWFKYRTSHGSVTMTIAPPPSKFRGFIFCMILTNWDNFFVGCLLENHGGEVLPLEFHVTDGNNVGQIELASDHVCICYAECSELINQKVEESKGGELTFIFPIMIMIAMGIKG